MKISNRLENFRSFGEVFCHRAKSKGSLWILSKTAQKLASWAGWVCLLPIAVVCHLLGFRRLTIFTDRIGHLAGELDCFEKERRLSRLPSKHRWFVLAPPGRVANYHLVGYWQQYVTVITNPLACRLLAILARKGPMVHDVSDYILTFEKSARYYEINAAWGNKPAVLTLTNEDQLTRQTLLAEFGMPPDAWFVCFHNREGGFSPIDESIHSHRNADIQNYIEAMQFIVSQGGWCIRMGDPSMKRLPPIPGVIDYAHHPLRSEQADIVLCASCRFFVGNSSGLFIAASVFGVPCALTNMIPTSTLGYSPRDIAIPKLLRHSAGHPEISFPSMFEQALCNYRLSSQFTREGVVPVENSQAEILGLVQEMHGKINNSWRHDQNDELLQSQFRALLKPNHYGHGAAGRVGALFLRQHRALLANVE